MRRPRLRVAAQSTRARYRSMCISRFVDSPCFYCGCNKIVTRQMERSDPYTARLFKEISMRSAYFDPSREVEQLHLGGGTPTFLTPDRLGALIDMLDRFFRLVTADSRDYSIEIDPRTVDASYIRTLAELGFNRISIGVQDFDPGVQSAINRIQPAELVQQPWTAHAKTASGRSTSTSSTGFRARICPASVLRSIGSSRCVPTGSPSTATHTCRRCSKRSARWCRANCRMRRRGSRCCSSRSTS
jgi:hypothetical protein